MAEIRHYLNIEAPAWKVYQALTEQRGLSAWWTDGTVAIPREGTIAEFNFGERYHNEMLITCLNENQQVSWKCLEGDPEWVGTTFDFRLESQREKTVLRFTHGNWREMTDFYASCNYHWGYYLGSLKKYCEDGIGYPFTAK